MVLAGIFCFIPSESNQHLTSAELEHGLDMPKSHVPIVPFHRWDEKAGLRRDAIRSQRLTRSRRNGKETGYEKD